jgi:TRAP transporter TAXI family solute receptor
MVLLLLFVAGCTATPSATPTPAPATTAPATGEPSAAPSDELKFDTMTRITFAGASIGGAGYTWTSGISQVLNEHVENLECTPEATGGPVANVGLISTHQSDIGQCTDCTGYEAYHGTGFFADKQSYPDIRGMFVAYPSGFQVFAIAGANDIKTMQDINGKICGYGPAGSTGDLFGHNVLRVLGITQKSDVYLPWSDTIGNLKDGMIDVCIDNGGFPHASRQELEATHEINFIRLTDEEIKKIQAEYPYYVNGTIPKGTYKDLTEDYETLFTWMDIICHKDADPDTVYMLVKAAYGVAEPFAAVSSLAKYLYPENITGCTIPMHTGAIRYFEEKNIKLADVNYPEEYKK